jgi:predicted DNA-binding transcriptional regulator AlpA
MTTKAQTRNDTGGNGVPILIDERQLEQLYNIRRKTAQRWRLEGRGPRFLKLEGLVRYRLSDIEIWIEQSTVGGTR